MPEIIVAWDDIAHSYLFCLYDDQLPVDGCEDPRLTNTWPKGANGYVIDWTGFTAARGVVDEWIQAFAGRRVRYAIKSCNGRREEATICSPWVISNSFAYDQ